MPRTDNANTSAAQVLRILDDMFSKTPKGSFIEWYTDLYNLKAKYRNWGVDVLPDVVASGVEARLMRDPSLARLEGRVKKATFNLICSLSTRAFITISKPASQRRHVGPGPSPGRCLRRVVRLGRSQATCLTRLGPWFCNMIERRENLVRPSHQCLQPLLLSN